MTKEEQDNHSGLYRFVLPFVKGKFCTWKGYRYKSNTPSHIYEGMEQVGIEQGANLADWFAVFENVPLANCLRCEVWNGETWRLHIDFTN